MIKAVEVPPDHNDFLRRNVRFMFVMQHEGQPERIMCVNTGVHDGQTFNVQGWFTDQEIWPEPGATPGHEPYIVTLDQAMLHAMTETLTIRATGTPVDMHGRLVRDLDHERERRDKLEDTLVSLLNRSRA